MAVADTMTLVFSVPWYFYMFSLGHFREYLYPSILCNLYNYMSEVLPAFFHTASIWLTLLLACQRYIYICHPSTAKVWCTNKTVTKVIGIIFLLAFVHQLLRFFESHYSDITLPAENLIELSENETTQQHACLLVMSDWVSQVEDVYYLSYFTFRILFVHIGPCLALVIFNVLLYSALKRAEVTRAKLFLKSHASNKSGSGSSPLLRNGHGRSQSVCTTSEQMLNDQNVSRRSICIEARSKTTRGLGSGRDANSTTFMLIVVVTVFLIVEIPLALCTLIHVVENVFNLEIVSDGLLNMTIIFTNFFIVISYPLNFAIYCGMSRAFRETFQQIFIRRIVETSSTGTTSSSTKCTGISASNSSRANKCHSVNMASDKSKQQLDNQLQQQQLLQTDLESSRRTSISSSPPLNERISRTAVADDCGDDGLKGSMATVTTITDLNGTQRATTALAHHRHSVLCETML